MSDSVRTAAELFSRDSRRREDVLTEFEEAWFRGERPDPADFLPDRRDRGLLCELLQVDLEFRLKAGEPVRVETYLGRFPELERDREALIELLASEFELRGGDPAVSPQEYVARFPQLAAELRKRLRPVGGEQGGGARAAVTIRVIDGPHRGLQYTCDRHETILIGRAREAQIRLNRDRHFSRYHLRLEVAPPACYLTDLDSRNGTLVNGEPVKRAFLKHGDVISGGGTKIAVTFAASRGDGRPAQKPLEGDKLAACHYAAVPGYELEELIGSGSMGCVYRAVQLATGATVAVKVISPAHAHDQEATRLFIREATVLSGLNHPGIVKLFEIGLAEGRPFLTMEYVDAVPHREILGQAGAGRTRIACAIVCHVLDALGHAHMQSLVHRDVKPANILLSRSGRKLQVKLADFGLARNYMVVGLSSITHDGDLRGTIAFMPPEQILDCRFAKPTCDLYAAGVTLYQYLSGRLPFDFGGDRSHFATVLNEEPIPLEHCCPDLPAGLMTAVNRAIAKDRGVRFVTAHEMREALLPFSRRSPSGS